jgi:sugar phosphate isomerase/epimerase
MRTRYPDFKGRRAFSSLGCGEMELHEVDSLAQRHDIGCVELRVLGAMVDLPAHFAACYGTPERFAEVTQCFATRVYSLGTSLRLVGHTDANREAMLAYVPWAQACGASTLRVFDGGSTGSREEIAEALATLRWWRQMREAEGWSVDLSIETHDAFALEDNLLRLLDAEPDCRLLWDAHHTWRKGGTHPSRTWEKIRQRVQHIHVKDSVVDPQARLGYVYVLPGDGEFPMNELMASLYSDEYDGVLSLEWERHWHAYLPPLDDALAAASQRSWW